MREAEEELRILVVGYEKTFLIQMSKIYEFSFEVGNIEALGDKGFHKHKNPSFQTSAHGQCYEYVIIQPQPSKHPTTTTTTTTRNTGNLKFQVKSS